jgi:hypothetical protein
VERETPGRFLLCVYPWSPSVAPAVGGFFLGEQSKVPWHLFQARQPRAHLVVGALAEVAADGDELAATLNLLKRLVRQQKPAGDYATTLARDSGRPEMYFAFDDEADARKFAATLEAGPTGRYPSWASQWTFEVDGEKLRVLAASLPLPKWEKRRSPPDRSSLRIRIRQWRRAPNTRYDEE